MKWKHFARYWLFVRGIHSVTGGFPSQRPVKRSFDVFFDPCLNKGLSKWSRYWWFEVPSCSLWHHYNIEVTLKIVTTQVTYLVVCKFEFKPAPVTLQKRVWEDNDGTAASIDCGTDVVHHSWSRQKVSLMNAKAEVGIMIFQVWPQLIKYPMRIAMAVGHEGIVFLLTKQTPYWYACII